LKKKPIAQTAELFVGACLGAARTKAGIPLEQAAKDTRIRVQRLREIESDDFSGFVHPTYVRLFLLDYASYLGVPLEEIRPMLPDRAAMATGGFEYLNILATRENKKPKTESYRPQHRLLVFLGALAVLFLTLVVGLYFLLTWRKFERVVLSRPIPAVVPEQAKPSPTPVATPPVTEKTGQEVALDIASPYEPAVSEPSPTPGAANPWPDVAVSPFDPSPSPSPSPTPTPKPPRRQPR